MSFVDRHIYGLDDSSTTVVKVGELVSQLYDIFEVL
jgi:hypothetical protein